MDAKGHSSTSYSQYLLLACLEPVVSTCDNPTKVDAKGHLSKSFRSICISTYKVDAKSHLSTSFAKSLLLARLEPVISTCDNPTKVDAKGHLSRPVRSPEKVDASGHPTSEAKFPLLPEQCKNLQPMQENLMPLVNATCDNPMQEGRQGPSHHFFVVVFQPGPESDAPSFPWLSHPAKPRSWPDTKLPQGCHSAQKFFAHSQPMHLHKYNHC